MVGIPRTASLAVVCAVAIGAVVVALDEPSSSARRQPPPSVVAHTGDQDVPRALLVLRDWDLRRARAFTSGSRAALTALYTRGSRTGAADLALLEGYRRRGLNVVGMSTQVLAAEVMHRSAGRIEMIVTDVLRDAVAVDGRGARWELPRDHATTWRVVLVRRGGRWLVDEAYPVY